VAGVPASITVRKHYDSMGRIIGLDINNGLANRMRVLDCFLDLAHNHDRQIVLYWPKEYGLYADFTELFEVPERVLKIVTFDISHSRAQRVAREFFNYLVYMLYSRVYHQKDIEQMAETQNFDCILKDRRPYIRTVTRLYIPKKPYAYLKPVKSLQDRINAFTSTFNDEVFGIHIRQQADNYRAREASPLELFVSRMQDKLGKNRNVKFFVATDTPMVRNRLKEVFPDNLILRDTSNFSRHEASGIKEALIDLYSLSRTKKIFGSFHSSFSEEAALLGGISLEVIKS
jgi:hypothetical protein